MFASAWGLAGEALQNAGCEAYVLVLQEQRPLPSSSPMRILDFSCEGKTGHVTQWPGLGPDTAGARILILISPPMDS